MKPSIDSIFGSCLLVVCLALGEGSSLAGPLPLAEESIKWRTPVVAALPNTKLSDFTFHVTNSMEFTIIEVDKGFFGGIDNLPFVTVRANRYETNNPIRFNGPPAVIPANLEFGIKIKSRENDIEIKNARFSYTIEGGEVSRLAKIPDLLDLKVVPLGDPDGLFTFINNSSNFITITNLNFLANSPEIPLLDPIGNVSGFASFSTEFSGFLNFLILAPGTTSDPFLFSNLSEGTWLYIEGMAFNSDSTGNPTDVMNSFRFGHQVPIPSPDTITLLGIGLVGLIYNRRRLQS